MCLVNGTPVRTTAQQFQLSPSAIQRHKTSCLKRNPPAITNPIPAPAYQSVEEAAVAERVSSTIISRVSSLVSTLENQAVECATDKDRRNMTATASALIKALELNARLTGELGPNNQTALQVNVGGQSMQTSPEWPVLVRVLTRHPEIYAELTSELAEAGL
ncbi:MAG: hypothetical protein GYA23_01895 [Methanomicrobiales archaeon]|nr:hypothetical protein [Methanomicrobiales archaeon]